MKNSIVLSQSCRRMLCAFFLTAMFFTGLFTLGQYGCYYDEGGERQIVGANIKEYVLRLLPEENSIRQFYLEADSHITDVDGKPISRISQSVERDHGAAIMYPVFPFLLLGIPSRVQTLIWHGYVFVIFFTSVPAMYFIGKTLLCSRFAGLLNAAIYFFTPRIFAEGHYNNKDILLLALTADLFALVLCAVKKYRQSGKQGSFLFLLMAVVAGFLMNLKVIGIAIVCLFGLMYIVMLTSSGMTSGRTALCSAALLGLSLVFYFLFTPAMWGGVREIKDFFKYLFANAQDFSRWDQLILFNGALYKHSVNPLPKDYLYTLILLTTPVYIIVFSIFGIINTLIRLFREKSSFLCGFDGGVLITSAVLVLVPTAYATFSGVHIYNGWRHFYFVYAGIIPLCTYGILRTGILIKARFGNAAKLYNVAVTAIVCFSILCTVINHPFQYAYFNFLAPHADERFELDYWNVSVKSAINYVIADSCEMSKPPTVGYSDSNTKIGLMSTAMFSGNEDKIRIVPEDIEADYVIENITYSNIYGQHCFDSSKYTPIKTFCPYGNKICVVYKHEKASDIS